MPKKQPTNAELLEFLQENVATKADLKNLATKEDLGRVEKIVERHTQKLVKIEATMATKQDLTRVEGKVGQLQTSVDNLAKDVGDLKVEKAARGMTIARLSYRTEHLLGPKVAEVDAEFERQYPAVGPPAAEATGQEKGRSP